METAIKKSNRGKEKKTSVLFLAFLLAACGRGQVNSDFPDKPYDSTYYASHKQVIKYSEHITSLGITTYANYYGMCVAIVDQADAQQVNFVADIGQLAVTMQPYCEVVLYYERGF